MRKPRIFFLVGPTSTGKTEAAIYLAKKLNAEIISCDSMQVYKGMDIITSKPSITLRKKVPHHLIGVLSPSKEYNVSRYRKDALKKVQDILKRGKSPLFVGGTGLYMTILVDGIFSLGKKSGAIRKQLYKLKEAYGNRYLYKRLQKVDPEAASKIHPNDAKRVIRALEVFKSTGKPISYLQKQRKGFSQEYGVKIFSLNMPREELYKRIGARVEKMFARGLLGEVKKLSKTKLSKTASYAIGIRELKGYFAGVYDLDEAKRRIKHNTCLYAKRQLTWFRKDKRVHWVNINDRQGPKGVAEKIWKELC
ncbi:MAG: tRNA (adenosine(37)-N6)-dimethylallyltransferase MiaA [Candidatus Omnitrophota bacterium]